jgi:phosphoribulokinase
MTESKTPFVLGVVGDSGSGKNTIADSVSELLGPERVSDVRLDDYHRFTREERAARGVTALNPMVHNTSLMQEHLLLLRQGRPIRNRSYDHADGTFGPIRSIEPHEVVIVRGLLGYPTDEMRGLYHLAVFLHPEAELLFRWKLRRDVLSRGYTEADVLKSIARHLLDSKEYVLPQAERADVVIRQELPDWEAEDADVRTIILLRRAAAAAVMEDELLQGLDLAVRMEDEEAAVELPVELPADRVAGWGRRHFPETYDAGHVGTYSDDVGHPQQRPQLAVVEVLIAALVESLRRRMESA